MEQTTLTVTLAFSRIPVAPSATGYSFSVSAMARRDLISAKRYGFAAKMI
jgi:hypothetical protein